MMKSIDAVISWVDGYDPVYQQKLNAFCRQSSLNQKEVIEPTRIQQCHEIYYCLHALRRFAPWLRHIYLITNAQTPSAVTALEDKTFANKIKIIDQNDLLRAEGITTPIFNSLSVEWLIWRIPGLSNQFLYLNDDFFIIRDVVPEDFFCQGRLILRGDWKVQVAQKWSYRLKKIVWHALGLPPAVPKTNPHRNWQEVSAQMAGYSKRFYLLPHAPFPLLRSTFEAQIAKNPQWIAQNASFPFRHPDQVSSIPLMVHHDISAQRTLHRSDCRVMMVHGSAHTPGKIRARLARAKRDKRVAFVCMQSIDEAPPKMRQEMKAWLAQQLDAHEEFPSNALI